MTSHNNNLLASEYYKLLCEDDHNMRLIGWDQLTLAECSDWLHEPRTPHCNTQLQTSFFKPEDSFIWFFLQRNLCEWFSKPVCTLDYTSSACFQISNLYGLLRILTKYLRYKISLYVVQSVYTKLSRIGPMDCKNGKFMGASQLDLQGNKADLPKPKKWEKEKNSISWRKTGVCNLSTELPASLRPGFQFWTF